MSSSFTISPLVAPQCAADALRYCGIPALRTISVREEAELIILQGRLPTYYLKQLAQETVLPYIQGKLIDNRIMVVQH